MRFSIWPSPSQPWGDLLEVVQHAEATGWDGVYVSDHFMGNGGDFGAEATPTFEATAVIGALASATSRLRLGTLVLGATYRHPAVLANWAATIDHASHGRLLLGIGTGWQANEHEQYGLALGSPGERLERFDEYAQVLLGLLRAPRTTVRGAHYEVVDAICEPKPLQQPLPVLIGGKGDRMLRLVARYADEWNMWGLAPVIADRSATLERACERIGRDPGEIRRSAQALVLLTDDADAARRFVEATPRASVAGTTSQIAEAVSALHQVGLDELIVPDFLLGTGAQKLDAMDALITEVAAAFR
jgi:alkanesulfonate monooxygenase SsuD/methylene tetrahydromethanopterin reductase-like flavin-dependent oxidoreductase (luciferase family)